MLTSSATLIMLTQISIMPFLAQQQLYWCGLVQLHSKTAYTGIHFLQLCMKSAVFTGYINTYLSQQKNHILVNKTSVSTWC